MNSLNRWIGGVAVLALQACNGIPGDIGAKQAAQAEVEVSERVRAQCRATPDAACGLLDPLPDRLPVLSAGPVPRGELLRAALPARTPSAKVVDGRIGDWIGHASRIGGAANWDAGEYIYSDYLFDAYGADDGVDARRLNLLDPLAAQEPRTYRIDQLLQAAGDQFGIEPPIGALDRYGDTTQLDAQADLTELRWAADADKVYVLARLSTLTEGVPALILLLDTQTGPDTAQSIGFGSGLSTRAYDYAVRIDASGVFLRDLASGEERMIEGAQTAIGAQGWDNAIEAALPATLFASTTRVAAFTGPLTEGQVTPANVAYRFHEPVSGVYNDKLQALALLQGDIDAFNAEISLADLRGGRSEAVSPGPGYHERQFVSGENISREEGENGILQPYGLYVPSAYSAAQPNPLTFWLHYRGGKAHSGAAWTPRLILQLGEEQNNIVATPRGRGTSTWYVTQAHQDFFEVYADIHSLMSIDPDRRYLSGYSMGGYGTYLFGLLYPDLFAAGYSTSGAITQGAWTGVGPDSSLCEGEFEIPSQGPGNACYIQANEGDAGAQLTYRLLENAREFPITIHHGSNDELVPVTGIARAAVRLTQLGYRHDMHTFFGYEHFTQAIIDEWADGAEYLNQFKRTQNPRKVIYKIVPSLVRAINTVRANEVTFDFRPEGAYWARGLVVADADSDDDSVFGMIEAESEAIAAPSILAIPRVIDGVSTPVASPTQHSTPYARVGLDWLELGALPVRNAFSATLTGLESASLDVSRMALDLSQPAEGTVGSDHAVRLTLKALDRAVQIKIGDGEARVYPAGDAVIDLPAGTHRLALSPAR